MIGTLGFLVLLAGSLATLPLWPYSRRWGFRPTAVLLLLLAIEAFASMNGWL